MRSLSLILLALWGLQGCSSSSVDQKPIDTLVNEKQINKEVARLKKYNRLQRQNKDNIEHESELFSKMERKIQYLAMDLFAKLNNRKESIEVSPVTLSDKISFENIEVRGHINSLLINELIDYAFPVVSHNTGSQLTLFTHLSQGIYQKNGYILTSFIKDNTSGEIKSSAQIKLEDNLIKDLKDGVNIRL
ncbi:MAG: hypothetical protein ACJAV1_000915 [Paraglaciecola sp.]|jgi:hypothetical protein